MLGPVARRRRLARRAGIAAGVATGAGIGIAGALGVQFAGDLFYDAINSGTVPYATEPYNAARPYLEGAATIGTTVYSIVMGSRAGTAVRDFVRRF
jgi:hypothetical protein